MSKSPFSPAQSTQRLLAALLLILVTAAALGFRLRPVLADATQTGTLTGRVVDTSGAPLAGITVTIYRDVAQDAIHRVLVTATDGTFVADTLVTGVYLLEFRDAQGTYATEFYLDAVSRQGATRIQVSGNQQALAPVVLERSGSIAGQVRMYNGDGPDTLELTLIDIREASWNDPQRRTTLVFTETLSQPVSYIFAGVQPGSYRLNAVAQYKGNSFYEYDANFGIHAGSPLTVTDGAALTGVDFVLGTSPDCGMLNATVVDPDGVPVPDIAVSPVLSSTYGWYPTYQTRVTDAEGRVEFRCLGAGVVDLHLVDDDDRFASQYMGGSPFPAPAAEIVAGAAAVEVTATLVWGGRIGGTARLAQGEQLKNVYLFLERQSSPGGSWRDYHGQFLNLTGSEDGSYVTELLLPGTYRMWMEPAYEYGLREWFANTLNPEQATLLTVSDGSILPGIDFELGAAAEAATVDGTVTDRDGLPLQNIVVSAVVGGVSHYSDRTDALGRYWLPLLPPGDYQVRFQDFNQHYLDGYYDDVASATEAVTLTLVAGQRLTGIDASLHRMGAISGKLRLFDQSWLDDYHVTAYREFGGKWLVYRGQSSSSIPAPGDAVDYALTGLPPGRYRVGAGATSYAYSYSGYYAGASSLDAATEVTVTLNMTTTGVDMTLGADTNNARITGTVTVDDVVKQGATVELQRWPPCSAPFLQTVTDETGGFAFPALAAGEYCLKLTYTIPDLDALPPPRPGPTITRSYRLDVPENDSRVAFPLALNSAEWNSRLYLPRVSR